VYIPEFNRVEDHTAIRAFLTANPFAILVSSNDGVPFATHLPVLTKTADETLIIVGHVAKSNPHWKSLQANREALVIFHGAHAYISPTLYEGRENVPTWNYAAVHVYGTASVFAEESKLARVLEEMIHTFEPSYMAQWTEMSGKYRERLLSHIVGFELQATRIEAKFKLSQNRTKGEQVRVMESLKQSNDTVISETGKMMQQIQDARK